MGKIVTFTLVFGLILVGAVDNVEGEESRRTFVGAETWLLMRSESSEATLPPRPGGSCERIERGMELPAEIGS